MGIQNGVADDLVTLVHGIDDPVNQINWVIVAEGYKAAEQDKFNTDIGWFMDHLFQVAPFNDPNCQDKISIYKLHVQSDESGADNDDETVGCGINVPRATYFDARHCFNNERRILVEDNGLVLATVAARLPHYDKVLVFVNSLVPGGSGGADVAVVATPIAVRWEYTAVHEMGHTAFGLGDEYEGAHNPPVLDNPPYPNLASTNNLAPVKWSSLVTTNPMQQFNHPDCNPANVGDAIVDGIVGAYEGANRYHCRYYRPHLTCLMRDIIDPFCPVCQRAIRQHLFNN